MNSQSLVSIHASVMEATSRCVARYAGPVSFDPRLRDGGDVAWAVARKNREVSIHASVMEATFINT